jgi:hypothetical protein
VHLAVHQVVANRILEDTQPEFLADRPTPHPQGLPAPRRVAHAWVGREQRALPVTHRAVGGLRR